MIGRIYGGFLKWWVSPFHTPSADHFYLENPWVCWGNPSFLDTPPYLFFFSKHMKANPCTGKWKLPIIYMNFVGLDFNYPPEA